MKKLDYTKPHLRFVSYKTITDENGNSRKERTFVLTPVKAKPKTKLTKEEVKAKKLAKVYISAGQRKDIPTIAVERDTAGKIVPCEVWSEVAVKISIELHNIHTKYLAETTKVITLPNGFKKTLRKKIKFRKLPSMILTSDERKIRLEEHKKLSKAMRSVRNTRFRNAKHNPTPITLEPLTFNTKARKERQAEKRRKHDEKINKLALYLRSLGKKREYTIIPAAKVESNEIHKTKYKPEIKFTGTKTEAVKKAFSVSESPGNEGALVTGKKLHVFAANLKAAA